MTNTCKPRCSVCEHCSGEYPYGCQHSDFTHPARILTPSVYNGPPPAWCPLDVKEFTDTRPPYCADCDYITSQTLGGCECGYFTSRLRRITTRDILTGPPPNWCPLEVGEAVPLDNPFIISPMSVVQGLAADVDRLQEDVEALVEILVMSPYRCPYDWCNDVNEVLACGCCGCTPYHASVSEQISRQCWNGWLSERRGTEKKPEPEPEPEPLVDHRSVLPPCVVGIDWGKGREMSTAVLLRLNDYGQPIRVFATVNCSDRGFIKEQLALWRENYNIISVNEGD